MKKSILFTLFGAGKIPRKILEQLRSEEIVLLEEGIPGTVELTNFKAPGRYSKYRKARFSGSLVITRMRVIGFTGSKPVINIPIEDPRINELDISVSGHDTLIFEFDAETFQETVSGHVVCRFKTLKAQTFCDVFKSLQSGK